MDEGIIKTHPERRCCSVCPVWDACNNKDRSKKEAEG